MFIGELLITKTTPEKRLESEHGDKSGMSVALANTPKGNMCLLTGISTRVRLLAYGSAVGAVCVSFLNTVFFVFWFNFAFVFLVSSWTFFSNLVFGLGFICGNRI